MRDILQVILIPSLIIVFLADGFGQIPDTLWTQPYGGIYGEFANSVVETADGGFFMTGHHDSSYDDAMLGRTDANGNLIWSKRFIGQFTDHLYEGRELSDGFIMAEETSSFCADGFLDILLYRVDINGDPVWVKAIGDSETQFARSIQLASDGGFVIAGQTDVNGWDGYLVKTDSNGDTLWTRHYGGSGSDYFNSVYPTAEGGYILAGETRSNAPGGRGNVYLVKTDANGDTLWTGSYGGSYSEFAWEVIQTADGGYAAIGNQTISSFPTQIDAHFIRFDASGNLLSISNYGTSNMLESGTGLVKRPDGGFLLATNRTISGTTSDIHIIRTDGSGNQLESKTFNGIDSENAFDIAITTPASGNGVGYVIAGHINRSGGTPTRFLFDKAGRRNKYQRRF